MKRVILVLIIVNILHHAEGEEQAMPGYRFQYFFTWAPAQLANGTLHLFP
jgi:hypothetical protein